MRMILGWVLLMGVAGCAVGPGRVRCVEKEGGRVVVGKGWGVCLGTESGEVTISVGGWERWGFYGSGEKGRLVGWVRWSRGVDLRAGREWGATVGVRREAVVEVPREGSGEVMVRVPTGRVEDVEVRVVDRKEGGR